MKIHRLDRDSNPDRCGEQSNMLTTTPEAHMLQCCCEQFVSVKSMLQCCCEQFVSVKNMLQCC